MRWVTRTFTARDLPPRRFTAEERKAAGYEVCAAATSASRGSAARPTAVYAQPLLETDEERARPHYVSHFATCPQADQHRRKAR